MKARIPLMAAVFAVALALAFAPSVSAQPRFEVGGSLASLMVGLDDDNDGKAFGIPSAGVGLVNPRVYGSFFLGDKAAIEPQIGLSWVSSDGESMHVLAAAAQFDLFLKGTTVTSPYVFAAGGRLDVSDSDETPKSVSAGAGIRIPAGDRLAFRIDGRYVHYTEEGGNALMFGLSIGGLFK